MPDKVKPCSGFCGTIVAFGFVILIYWAIFQPHDIHANVDAVTLSNFTVSGASTPSPELAYRLNVSLRLYNPSLRVGIYYDSLDAALRFHDAMLGLANETSPEEFFQKSKSSDIVQAIFEGRVAGDVAAEYAKEKGEGPVNVEVWVDARVRYKLATVRIRQKPWIRCFLRIPSTAESGGGGGVLGSGEPCSVKQ